MGTILLDFRQSLRNLVKSPSFALLAISVLALGIGANTAVFSLLNAFLFRPLPYPDADRLVFVERSFPDGFGNSVSIPKFNVWRDNHVLEDMAIFDFGGPGLNLRGGDKPELVKAIHVSEAYFRLFGATTIEGRTFSAEEDQPNGPKVAVLSHGLWMRLFGGSREILGQTVTLGNDAYTVVGVLNPNYHPQPEAEVWLPLQPDPNSTNQGHYLQLGAKLKPGITLAKANAELKLVGEKFRQLYPEWINKKESVAAIPMLQERSREFRPVLFVLMGAVAMVLLIACANLANLLLARAVSRQRSVAVHFALGATRRDLIRYLLMDSLLLAAGGAIAGLLVAYAGLQALLHIVTTNVPEFAVFLPDASIMDWRVLTFTLVISTATALLFGIVPALQFSRPDLNSVLQSGGRSGTGRARRRTHSILVVGEIALALVLLVSATLLIRTIRLLRTVDPGFNSHNVVVMETSLASTRYTNTAALAELGRRIVERLESIPGVISASPTILPPMVGEDIDLPFTIEGKPPTGGDLFNGDVQWRFIGAHYFAALTIPIQKGRAFTDQDNGAAAKVVIINATMAKKYWPNGEALGQRITIGGKGLGAQFEDPPREIVGIVGDVREDGLGKPAPPIMYVPMSQMSDALIAWGTGVLPFSWIVHTAANPSSVMEAVKQEFLAIDDDLPVAHVRTLAEANAVTLGPQNIAMNLLSVFAALALALATIGIYGLMWHSVQQRTQELGIRMSLGASKRDIYHLILKQAATMTIAGIFIGIAGAIGATRVLASMLFGVRSTDPLTFLAVASMLAVVSVLAAYLPARRATTINPIIALREMFD